MDTTHHNILSIDGGVCEKTKARIVRPVDGCAVAYHERWPSQGIWIVRIVAFDRYDGPRHYEGIAEVVVERPAEDGRSHDVRPRDLINLAWDSAMLACSFGVPVKTYTPREWKGQLHKPVHHQKIWRKLHREERALFHPGTEQVIAKAVDDGAKDRWAKDGKKYYPASFVEHNLLDAIGLGRFHLLGDEAW